MAEPLETRGARIDWAIRRSEHRTIGKIAKLINVKRQAVYAWIKNTNDPGANSLWGIARNCGVSFEWLQSGRGSPFQTYATGVPATEFPQWAEFLKTPGGRRANDEEKALLSSVVFPEGTTPTARLFESWLWDLREESVTGTRPESEATVTYLHASRVVEPDPPNDD